MKWTFDLQFKKVNVRVNFDVLKKRIGVDPEELKGKEVLDAGCGHGFNAKYLASFGANMTGIDMSDIIQRVKKEEQGKKKNKIDWVQTDIVDYNPEKRFDFIYSTGVLHHTPNPEKTFLHLASLLKEDGKIVVWVYHHYEMNVKAIKFWRKIIHKVLHLPGEVFWYLCYLAIPMHYVQRLKIFRWLNLFFPVHVDKMHVKDILYSTYDMYIHKYNYFHTYPEVYGWFKKAGLREIEVADPPVTVRGVR